MEHIMLTKMKKPTNLSWLKAIDEFISENIGNNSLTITDVANAIYMSERQVYRKVKKFTGKTPNKYLQSLRLNKAKEYLEAGTFSTVKEVAISVGYSRSDYFSRLYETHFGVRPIKYFQTPVHEEMVSEYAEI